MRASCAAISPSAVCSARCGSTWPGSRRKCAQRDPGMADAHGQQPRLEKRHPRTPTQDAPLRRFNNIRMSSAPNSLPTKVSSCCCCSISWVMTTTSESEHLSSLHFRLPRPTLLQRVAPYALWPGNLRLVNLAHGCST